MRSQIAEAGYYVRRNPISGDFITAPEISQIFGELIGLFLVQAWEDRGRPGQILLIELGPGRGTLMADVLRAARVRPEFLHAAGIHLVEVSPVLRAAQQQALGQHRVSWHSSIGEIAPDAPAFIVANEFFDALPVRQFVRSGGAWRERKIALDGNRFYFCLDAAAAPCPDRFRTIFATLQMARFLNFPGRRTHWRAELAVRVVRTGGVALIIDYGHVHSGLADTFQAVQAHRFADPLAMPGDADLTCHVDFAALRAAALEGGAEVSGPVPQGRFLRALGIHARAEMLKRDAIDYAATIDSGVERLVSDAQMGSLFKVMGLSSYR